MYNAVFIVITILLEIFYCELRLRTLIVYEFELLAPKSQLAPQSQLRQGRNSSNLNDYFLQFKNLLMNDFWLKILSKEGAKNVTSPGTVTSLQT
jgi:hypothetical protein